MLWPVCLCHSRRSTFLLCLWFSNDYKCSVHRCLKSNVKVTNALFLECFYQTVGRCKVKCQVWCICTRMDLIRLHQLASTHFAFLLFYDSGQLNYNMCAWCYRPCTKYDRSLCSDTSQFVCLHLFSTLSTILQVQMVGSREIMWGLDGVGPKAIWCLLWGGTPSEV